MLLSRHPDVAWPHMSDLRSTSMSQHLARVLILRHGPPPAMGTSDAGH